MFIFYTLSRDYRVLRNWYSRLLITSEDRLCSPICEYTNNRLTWRHRTSAFSSRDATDQPLWRLNSKPENTLLGNMGDR